MGFMASSTYYENSFGSLDEGLNVGLVNHHRAYYTTYLPRAKRASAGVGHLRCARTAQDTVHLDDRDTFYYLHEHGIYKNRDDSHAFGGYPWKRN